VKTATPDPPDEPGRIQALHVMASTVRGYNVQVGSVMSSHVQASALQVTRLEAI
jgi:hypothetical protein